MLALFFLFLLLLLFCHWPLSEVTHKELHEPTVCCLQPFLQADVLSGDAKNGTVISVTCESAL